MTPAQALEELLRSYRRYYDVTTQDPAPPFAAEAVFHSHDEQYFLVKRAKLAEVESHEYVFFATVATLGLAEAQALDDRAWQEGLSRVRPHAHHRSTDIVLVLLAEKMTQEAKDFIASARHYQSYRFTLQGWSHYSLVAMETSSGALFSNKRGRDLKKLLKAIDKQKEGVVVS